MTDFTGKLIANTYKDILTINSSATNDGLDNTLRRVQDGEGTNSSLKLSETSAAFTGNVSVNGNLTINGAFQPQNIQTSAVRATTVSATNITTDVLTAGTLTFQDVSVSTLRAGTVSATTINAGSTLTVDGDNVITSAVAVSTAAILRAQIATTIANTSAALQNNIDVVSVGLSATNTQTQINATQINTLSTSIAANASAITVNESAITSVNTRINAVSVLAETKASAATSATLETRIAGVSSTMATSIGNQMPKAGGTFTGPVVFDADGFTINSNASAVFNGPATMNSNIALGNSSTDLITGSGRWATNIIPNNSTSRDLGTDSLRWDNAYINTFRGGINAIATSVTDLIYPSSYGNAPTNVDYVGTAIATKASVGTSATLETRIAAVSSTMATSIGNSNSAITALSATMATSIGNSNSAITALSATMATSIATRLALAGGTMTGNLILNADPSANLQAASKQYVDNLTASSIHVHEAVRVETNTTNLNATYNNGTAGVGATLTNAGTQAALVVDGVTVNTSDRVLVLGQTNQTQNGVYVVTNTGSGSTNWILTRSDDADTSGDGSPDTLDEGSYFFVQEGTVGAAHAFVCNTQGTIVFGTTNITFAQFSDSVEYTAGTGINVNASRVISTSGVPTNAELAAVSATMATSIANSNSAIIALSATLESRIAGVSAIVPTSLTELGITDGSNGQVLQTDGNSVFTFVSVAGGGSGTVTNIKAGSNISMTEAGTTVTETTTSATIAVTASPTFSSAVITGDLTVDTNTLYVDSTNNRVGIGTSSPDARLSIIDGTSSDQLRMGSSTSYYKIGRNTSTGLLEFNGIQSGFNGYVFGGANGERMRIDSGGNVGIGTNSPRERLDVVGDAIIEASFNGTQFIRNVDVASAGLAGHYLGIGAKYNGNPVTPIVIAGSVDSDGTANAFAVRLDDSEKMRIDSIGNVGIGTSSPSKRLESASTSLSTVKINGYTANSGLPMYSYNDSGGCGWATGDADSGSQGYANLIYLNDIDNSFNVYLGQAGASNQRMKLEADGDLHVDGNVVAYSTTISDKRLKKDIAPIDNALWRVSQLNGCTFTYLKDDRKSAGLIAQDLEKVLPSAVIEGGAVFHGEEGETYKTVQYDQVIGLLVEAVKELTAKVEELENASTK